MKRFFLETNVFQMFLALIIIFIVTHFIVTAVRAHIRFTAVNYYSYSHSTTYARCIKRKFGSLNTLAVSGICTMFEFSVLLLAGKLS